MDTGVIGQIAAIRKMTVAELRREWERLNDEPARSKNRDYLWRRLAWRVQEIAHGGLPSTAKARIDDLAPDTFARAATPRGAVDAVLAASAQTADPESRRIRDPRLPAPGSVITKPYKGRDLRVTVRDDGFEFDGAMYASLTAIAKYVTGSKNINGKLFFGLTTRRRS